MVWFKNILVVFLSLMTVAYAGVGKSDMRYGSISGYVIDGRSGEPLPNANVVILGSTMGTATDAKGKYTILSLPVGEYNIQATYLGYKPQVKAIGVSGNAGQGMETFSLAEDNIKMNDVQVHGVLEGAACGMPLSAQNLQAHELAATAGGFSDISRVISALPGVAPTSVDRNDLIVRGGAPSENLFLIDNIEVPTLNHFATQGFSGGSASTIDPELINQVNFSSGGFGVQYGDKLSSVLSLSLREGNHEHQVMKATVSATQYGVSVEGPLSTHGSYLISARKSFLDMVFRMYDMSFAPVYTDVLAKISYTLGVRDKIEFLTMIKKDDFRQFNDTEDHIADNSTIIFSNQNAIVSGLTWKHVTKRMYSVVTLAKSHSYYYYYQTRPDNRPDFNNTSLEDETSLSVDVVNTLSASTDVSLGFRGKHTRFSDDLDLKTIPWSLSLNNSFTEMKRSIDTTAIKLNAYIQLSHTLGNVVVNAGIRADYFNFIEKRLVFSPRLSATCHASSVTDLTVSIGRYYQSPAYKWLANPYNRALLHARDDQVVLGITHWLSEDWNINLEAYTKTYADYPVSIDCPVLTIFNSGATAFDYQDFGIDSLASVGTGSSHGLEILIRKKTSAKPLSGMLSITYSRTNFTTFDGISRPSDHDQRLISTLILNYRMNPVLEFSSRFRIYTGRPYLSPQVRYSGTMEEFYREYNKMRVGINHSLDVRMTRQWRLGKTTIDSYIDIQNVYNRKPVDVPVLNVKTGQFVQPNPIGILPSVGITVIL